MALIICPECNGKVSDKATACIHCGYPLQMITKMEDTLKMARRARTEGNTKDAQKYYEVAYQENPSNLEASFFLRYYQVVNATYRECTMLGNAFANSISEVVALVKERSSTNCESAIIEIHQYCKKVADILYCIYKKARNPLKSLGCEALSKCRM